MRPPSRLGTQSGLQFRQPDRPADCERFVTNSPRRWNRTRFDRAGRVTGTASIDFIDSFRLSDLAKFLWLGNAGHALAGGWVDCRRWRTELIPAQPGGGLVVFFAGSDFGDARAAVNG